PLNVDSIFYKDPPFLYLSEYASSYRDDFLLFMKHLQSAISKMSLYLNTEIDEVDADLKIPIHLMTALRAKGKEYDTVIVLDVVDDIWPIKYADTEERLEQERRLFYVAITRPRKTLILITVDKILNKRCNPSPYLDEMEL
ncbi:unnamed protein product, partial [marine sediment metagenome]